MAWSPRIGDLVENVNDGRIGRVKDFKPMSLRWDILVAWNDGTTSWIDSGDLLFARDWEEA